MTSNQTQILIIIITLAVLAFGCIGTICILSFYGIPIPPELNTMAGSLGAGLLGMLVKTSPTEATKVNPPTF